MATIISIIQNSDCSNQLNANIWLQSLVKIDWRLFELLSEPILGQFVQFPYLVDAGEVDLTLEGTFCAGVHHLQLDLTVAWRIEYKAHRIRNPGVVMNHLVRVYHIARLMAGQQLLQFVNGHIVQAVVQHHQLLLAVDLYYTTRRTRG